MRDALLCWSSRQVSCECAFKMSLSREFGVVWLATGKYILRSHAWLNAGWWLGTLFFPYIGKNHPNWRTHIFQRGRSTTNQVLSEGGAKEKPFGKWRWLVQKLPTRSTWQLKKSAISESDSACPLSIAKVTQIFHDFSKSSLKWWGY